MISNECWQDCAREALPGLYRLAFSILRRDADAQDAVQTALMKSWEFRDRVDEHTCRPYLTRILINECHNIQRKDRRMTPVDEFPESAAPQEGHMREIIRAIEGLPEKDRLPIQLRYLSGLSEKECAKVLKLPGTTFRSRLFRARKKLSMILEEEVDWS